MIFTIKALVSLYINVRSEMILGMNIGRVEAKP
jgi:hypothetical protein